MSQNSGILGIMIGTLFAVFCTIINPICCAIPKCPAFHHKTNISVNCELVRNFNEPVLNVMCMRECKPDNCTAVATETNLLTTWCCSLGSGDVIYYPGNNTLYHHKNSSIAFTVDYYQNLFTTIKSYGK